VLELIVAIGNRPQSQRPNAIEMLFNNRLQSIQNRFTTNPDPSWPGPF